MSDAEYRSLLDEVDSALPKWERALKGIDPAKDARVSYAVGKLIVQQRDRALMEVGYVRQYVVMQRQKRTVSGELALSNFLRGVFDAMDSIVVLETSSGLSLSNLEDYAPQLSNFAMRVSNDTTAKVEALEKRTCP